MMVLKTKCQFAQQFNLEMYLKIWFENEKKTFLPYPPARFRPAGPVGPAGHHPSPPPLSHPLTGRARLSASSPPNRFSPPLSQFSNRSRPSRSHVPHSSPPRLGFLWRSSAPEPPSPSPHFASLAPATLAAHRKPSPATSARAIRELDRPRRFRCVGELPPLFSAIFSAISQVLACSLAPWPCSPENSMAGGHGARRSAPSSTAFWPGVDSPASALPLGVLRFEIGAP